MTCCNTSTARPGWSRRPEARTRPTAIAAATADAWRPVSARAVAPEPRLPGTRYAPGRRPRRGAPPTPARNSGRRIRARRRPVPSRARFGCCFAEPSPAPSNVASRGSGLRARAPGRMRRRPSLSPAPGIPAVRRRPRPRRLGGFVSGALPRRDDGVAIGPLGGEVPARGGLGRAHPRTESSGAERVRTAVGVGWGTGPDPIGSRWPGDQGGAAGPFGVSKRGDVRSDSTPPTINSGKCAVRCGNHR
jgi:hypothetical protein